MAIARSGSTVQTGALARPMAVAGGEYQHLGRLLPLASRHGYLVPDFARITRFRPSRRIRRQGEGLLVVAAAALGVSAFQVQQLAMSRGCGARPIGNRRRRHGDLMTKASDIRVRGSALAGRTGPCLSAGVESADSRGPASCFGYAF